MTRNFSRLAMLLAALLPAMAFAQTREKGPWWPNAQWGAGDAAGGSNWITPEKVLQAVALVKTGRIRELGHAGPVAHGPELTRRQALSAERVHVACAH